MAFSRSRWRAARNLGAGLDLLRFAGPRYAWQRWRDQAAWAAEHNHAATVYEAIWAEAAAELDSELRPLSSGFHEIRRGERRTLVWMHWVALDDIVSVRLALDKPAAASLLADAGLPVPEYREFHFRELAPARDFLAAGDGPCVVKPASGTSGGEGVTSGVRTVPELERAALRASRGDARLLIERQAAGDAYRLLLCDGELLDVVRRRLPEVVGDGYSSISRLIAAENRRRIEAKGGEGLRILKVDLDCALTLEHAGLGLSSIPAAGERVAIKGVVSQNSARENETVREVPSDQLVDAAREAAAVLGLRLAGVDLHTPDLGQPPAEAGGAIVEVNGTPGLHYHYQVAEPENATRVAVPILARALDEGG